jgi:hypothetical protein
VVYLQKSDEIPDLQPKLHLGASLGHVLGL